MSILPSGKRKLVKYQQYSPSADMNNDGHGIEQESLPNNGNNASQPNYDPIGDLSQSLNNANGKKNVNPAPKYDDLKNAVDRESNNQPSNDDGAVPDGGSIKLKEFIDQYLIKTGVPQRKLIEHDKRRFQYNRKQQNGFFEVPERTGTGKVISEDDVDNLCNQIESKFNLDTEPVFQGGIWRIQFKQKIIEQKDNAVTSWDGQTSNKNMNKAANGKYDLFKNSRDSIVETIMKKMGGDNAPKSI